ncbi:MAG: DUF2254 domain-containing protein [Tissierellia bacterium]|nr:DUF2254 domain-containing protein [Tissierellia bacterium]
MIQKLKLKYQKNKIWMYPLKYILVAFILLLITVAIDTRYYKFHKYIPHIFLTSISLAQTILGALVGSLLSITTFTFSTTMVVLTMYSSDFSPRVVENFLNEKITLKVLGMFMGGFFYSVSSLLFMRKSLGSDQVVSASIGVFYAILCMIYFAIFVNKVSSSIQASNLITKLHEEADDSIKNAKKYHEKSKAIYSYDVKDYKYEYPILSDSSGYLELVAYDAIFNDIKEGDYTLIIHPNNGDFVVRSETIATLYSKDEEIDENIIEKMNNHFTLQSTRDISYDYLFAIEKIVDVALRAISPGINDPNTARECINILGMLTSELSEINGNYSEKSDEESKSKLIYPSFNFDHDLFLTFYQIIIYGKEDLSVVLAVYKALENTMRNATFENRMHVKKFLEYLDDKSSDNFSNKTDREVIEMYKEKVLEAHQVQNKEKIEEMKEE